jgi:hypothetical protein
MQYSQVVSNQIHLAFLSFFFLLVEMGSHCFAWAGLRLQAKLGL